MGVGMGQLSQNFWWQKKAILRTKVFHARLIPRANQFTYHVYYLGLPVKLFPSLEDGVLCKNRFGLLSFYDRDHGLGRNEDSANWAITLFASFDIDCQDADITLITMPRTCGFVFNPVSFWLLISKQGLLKAVIAEVNNTFGETHSYVLAHDTGIPMQPGEWFSTQKHFHVSPFLPVEGSYQFRFALSKKGVGIWIDYYDKDQNKTLLTAMTCNAQNYSKARMLKQLLMMPLVSLKVVLLIHFQAIKLIAKKIRYRRKPAPPDKGVTRWDS